MRSQMMLLVLFLFALIGKTQANQAYEFVTNDDQLPFATLVLSKLPATQDDVLSFSFTESGQQLFGFEPLYGGTFDKMSPPGAIFIANDRGSLSGIDPLMAISAMMIDSDPPKSDLPELVGSSQFSFRVLAADTGSSMGYTYFDRLGMPHEVHYAGEWVAVVPEPVSGTMTASLTCFAASMFRRRRNVRYQLSNGGAK